MTVPHLSTVSLALLVGWWAWTFNAAFRAGCDLRVIAILALHLGAMTAVAIWVGWTWRGAP